MKNIGNNFIEKFNLQKIEQSVDVAQQKERGIQVGSSKKKTEPTKTRTSFQQNAIPKCDSQISENEQKSHDASEPGKILEFDMFSNKRKPLDINSSIPCPKIRLIEPQPMPGYSSKSKKESPENPQIE